MDKENVVLENYHGLEIRTIWNDKEDMLYINKKDAKDILALNEGKSFKDFEESVFEELTFERSDERTQAINSFSDFSIGEYIDITKVINLLKFSKSESCDEVALWLVSILIKYLKKKGNVKIKYKSCMFDSEFISEC